MDLKNRCVVVEGSGISGIGACHLLNQVGAHVILHDSNEKLTEDELLAKLNGDKAELIIGKLEDEKIKAADLLVISPGVPIDSEIVKRFEAADKPVWGEIELAYNYEAGKVLAITGTNGKTTTTSLVGEIVKSWGKKTFVVGNIGHSYTLEVLGTDKDSYTVAEISSFQLETVHDFKPAVSAILNITPDHLNRHHTMECYIETKEKIAMNQSESDICVLNYDDSELRKFANACKPKIYWFSSSEKVPCGSYVENDEIIFTDGEQETKMLNVHDMNLIGRHNYENVCAAINVCMAAGIPVDLIVETVKKFKAVEHRIEYVATKNGVLYYNDSKGTNPEASVKAIEAMSRPTYLIGGGYDKGSEFDLYVKAFAPNIKKLILIGQTSEKIAATCDKYGFKNYQFVESLEEVVDICHKEALPGEAVLLSPACASWGMFDNYEQRGRMFKDFVNALED